MRIVVAESCTGGLLAAAITAVPGASLCFDSGYVTYSAASKERLGVAAEIIERCTAVSDNSARAMAEAAIKASGCDISCAITGVAGPGPDADGNPEGLVFVACSFKGATTRVRRYEFGEGRDHIRQSAVDEALAFLLDYINGGKA